MRFMSIGAFPMPLTYYSMVTDIPIQVHGESLTQVDASQFSSLDHLPTSTAKQTRLYLSDTLHTCMNSMCIHVQLSPTSFSDVLKMS